MKKKWTPKEILTAINMYVSNIDLDDSGWNVYGKEGFQSEEYDSLEEAVIDLVESIQEAAAAEALEIENKERAEYARLKAKYES